MNKLNGIVIKVTANEAIEYYREFAANCSHVLEIVTNQDLHVKMRRKLIMAEMAADAIEQCANADQWIDAAENPIPDLETMYVVCLDSSFITYASFYNTDHGGEWRQNGHTISGVTHYHPFPKLPNVRN